ncbi:hypothetical protein DPEC_G00325110 [Dallia pectoralis]|uniref:Uncharacterized protein n=1 Tax=Dallia pectoralis TaxID=75939 RepID=A0ACC2FB59_DALPE|nr:hypothetical protein DPEC_G00325110 [Dallia pectoralis]
MDPADHEQLRNAVCLQEAAIGKQGALLQGVMEGLKDVSARHDRTYQALLEQFQTLSTRLTPTTPPANPSNMVSELASAPLAAAVPHEPRLPHPERFDGDPETCRLFISQCSLIFELQLSTFPTERSKVAYLVTLMSGHGGVANYAIEFRTLAAESTWNTSSLFDAFLHVLFEEIKDELATRELPSTLEALIFLAIRIDSRLRE